MPNIKLQPVRNEAAIQTEVDELRRKYPQKIVNVVRRVAAGISYADAKGNRHEFVPTDQIWYEPTLADLEAETRELAESDPKEFGGWPNDGTKMLKTAKVKIEGGGVAKDCRYFPLGHILSIEVRDAKGACYTDLSYEQRPVVNTFRLHSPYTH